MKDKIINFLLSFLAYVVLCAFAITSLSGCGKKESSNIENPVVESVIPATNLVIETNEDKTGHITVYDENKRLTFEYFGSFGITENKGKTEIVVDMSEQREVLKGE